MPTGNGISPGQDVNDGGLIISADFPVSAAVELWEYHISHKTRKLEKLRGMDIKLHTRYAVRSTPRMIIMKSVFVVHFRSPTESIKNVFIASDEDTAISYCLQWTSI